MGSKRPAPSGAQEPPAKKPKGFRVGPSNLPDGPWKRKLDRKKADLIHTAKVKKTFAKVKAQHEKENAGRLDATRTTLEQAEPAERAAPASLEINPARQAMIDTTPAFEPKKQRQTRRRYQIGEDGGPPVNLEELGARKQGTEAMTETVRDPETSRNPAEETPQDLKPRNRSRKSRPADVSYTSALARAAAAKEAAEAREAEYARRTAEREAALKDRAKAKKAMARARGVEKRTGRFGDQKGGRRNDAGQQRRLGREGGILLEKIQKMMGK